MISLIVAMSRNNVIGAGGELPWHLPDDLRRFKSLTMGKPVVMGRKTYESIGRALPGRKNIVITRQADFAAEDCDIVASPDAALEAAGVDCEVMIIGGAEIYRQFLDNADRVYRTVIDRHVDGDAFFPNLPASDWAMSDVEGREDFEFQVLDRRRSSLTPGQPPV